MRYVILRDDDTNALTPIECLETLYRPFLDRGLPVNLANALGGGSVNSLQGFTMPAWTLWTSVATGLVSAALFVWMLVALVRYGPWAMRRAS